MSSATEVPTIHRDEPSVRRGRPRPPLFRALGRHDPPAEVQASGQTFRRIEIWKHDSWAATGLYEANDGQRIVCKFNRQEAILGLPMAWLGRWLGHREMRMYRRLADLSLVPNGVGPIVADGRTLPYVAAHEFIPGRAFGRGTPVSDDFFPQLRELLAEVHRRGVAYNDLNKGENILVGDDGRPRLIDFQISVCLPMVGPLGWLLRQLQQADRYHVVKHDVRRGVMQDALVERELARERPWWIRFYRLIGVPLRESRRKLLTLLGIRKGRGRVESEAFAEIALREAAAASLSTPAIATTDVANKQRAA